MTPGARISLLHCQRCGRTWKQYALDGEKFPARVGCYNCRREYRLKDLGENVEMIPEVEA